MPAVTKVPKSAAKSSRQNAVRVINVPVAERSSPPPHIIKMQQIERQLAAEVQQNPSLMHAKWDLWKEGEGKANSMSLEEQSKYANLPIQRLCDEGMSEHVVGMAQEVMFGMGETPVLNISQIGDVARIILCLRTSENHSELANQLESKFREKL